jgi:hypothetical protein
LNIGLEASGSYSWLVDEMPPVGSEAANGANQENRQTGRQRIGDTASKWHPAGNMDSTGRVAISTRVVAAADFSREVADAGEESNPWHVIST